MINWAIQVDPKKWYPVRYTINHQRPEKGRNYTPTFLKGGDMTENQIKKYVMGLACRTT